MGAPEETTAPTKRRRHIDDDDVKGGKCDAPMPRRIMLICVGFGCVSVWVCVCVTRLNQSLVK